MKRAKGEESSNSADRISELPEGILQRVMYFLTQEEAVRSSVLSKSWRYLWCTRPSLIFSDATFKGNKQEFLSAVDNTLQLYCDQKMCVEELSLCVLFDDSDHDVSFLEKCMATLTNMGTKKFCLSIRSKHRHRRAKLPSVIFGAEYLQDLHVKRFKLDEKTIQSIVLLTNLKSVSLKRVSVKVDIFEKIILCCPLIETLGVKECKRLRTINVNGHHNLKNFTFFTLDFPDELCSIEIHPSSLETIHITQSNILIHKGADFRILKSLSLWLVTASLEHLSSCKFPSLENLRISSCDGLEGIQLFIDAPNINSFQYGGNFVPSISFATTSNEWTSRIHLSYRQLNDAPSSWYLKLKELLKSLSQSEIISISIYQYRSNAGNIMNQENVNLVQDNTGRDKPVAVKSLSLNCHLSSISSILNVLFRICRPSNIRHYCNAKKSWMEFTEGLYKILMQRKSGELWEGDLEEVSMNVYDKDRKEWHSITLSELPNYQEREHIITRFPLKWR